jgi:hypothetical protein
VVGVGKASNKNLKNEYKLARTRWMGDVLWRSHSMCKNLEPCALDYDLLFVTQNTFLSIPPQTQEHPPLAMEF